MPGRVPVGAKSLLSSLSLRLFVLLFGTIIVVFGVYAVLNIRSTSRQWQQTVYEGAQRFSDLIQHSTHYSMLLNRKEDVHHIIRTIADAPGVEHVRIYDKQGVIIFSEASEEIGERVDLRAEACVSCHTHEVPLQSVPEGSRVRVFGRPQGGRVLGLINPIENAPECYTAACHAHPQEQSILGVLDVTMSMAEPDLRMATARRQALVAAVLMALLAGVLSAAFILRLVRRPVKHLITGTERVASGDLATEISVASHDEIGQLAKAFNHMTSDLREANKEITEWSDRLESRLQEKTAELSQTQRQVAHMDKMASLGKLAASVAHELNNPIAGILNYAKLIDRNIRESEATIPEREKLARYLSLIEKEAGRSGDIVRNLLIFARPSGTEFALHSLNPIIERSVMLVRHHVEMADIRLETRLLENDDKLVCHAGQIQQALLALLMNAVEAMPNGGTIRLAAEEVGESVRITISDTGIGIPKEILPNIFEPFFSSKDRPEAIGLGLALVYGTVRHHLGNIEVESEINRGTTFRVTLPRRPAWDRDEPARATSEGKADVDSRKLSQEATQEEL
jgi:two-component system NtrC family sensor kinase